MPHPDEMLLTPEEAHADREAREAAAAKAKNESVSDDARLVMGTAAGRRFVWRVLAAAGLTSASMVPGDALLTYFNEGRRDVARMLARELEEDAPDAFALMHHEAQDRALTERAELLKSNHLASGRAES